MLLADAYPVCTQEEIMKQDTKFVPGQLFEKFSLHRIRLDRVDAVTEVNSMDFNPP